MKTFPTSVRLRPAELDEVRDAAAFAGVSTSDLLRRAVVAYLGIEAADLRRRDMAATVVELGRIRTDVSRIGNLLKLAATTGRPPMAETERDLRHVLGELNTAVTTLCGPRTF